MVAFVIGQSHAANFIGERFVGGEHAFNRFEGKCYAARDPLLGTEGGGGNVWTLVASKLIERRLFADVVLVTGAVGATRMAQWAPGGDLHNYLLRTLQGAMQFTHVFIQLGTSDYLGGTDYNAYKARSLALIRSLRQASITAPIFMSVESAYCGSDEHPPVRDNPITRAQRDLAESAVFIGPDFDTEIGAGLRYDGCHFSSAGARKAAELWVAVIERSRGATAH
jgi:lysophospholipase L1-like esterase